MKILIAEDNTTHRELLSYVFRDTTKYEVLEAKNGPEAVRLAADHQPDIILMDVRLPNMDDGLVALEYLRADKITTNIPVVLMSCLFTSKQRKRGTELGAVDFLQKPFEALTLEAKVKQWAEGG